MGSNFYDYPATLVYSKGVSVRIYLLHSVYAGDNTLRENTLRCLIEKEACLLISEKKSTLPTAFHVINKLNPPTIHVY